MTALRPLRGLVVIDEVQRRPELFPVLRVLADRPNAPARFLVLGSASGDLLRQSSESLAVRVERVVMGGFTLRELGSEAEDGLWLHGGLPPSYFAPAEAARALGVGESTARRYLDFLTDALMARQLPPYFANIGKRQVKSPKVYIRDSGILHRLLGVDSLRSLLDHPTVGASWEGFVIEQLLMTEPHDEAFFWATYQGAEMDLVLRRGGELFGVECKRADAPRLTSSVSIADLRLSRVAVHPGLKRYPLSDTVEAVPLRSLAAGSPIFPEARS